MLDTRWTGDGHDGHLLRRGIADRISPWQACSRSAASWQAKICGSSSRRAAHRRTGRTAQQPEGLLSGRHGRRARPRQWAGGGAKHADSWWPETGRGSPRQRREARASKVLGSMKYPPMEPVGGPDVDQVAGPHAKSWCCPRPYRCASRTTLGPTTVRSEYGCAAVACVVSTGAQMISCAGRGGPVVAQKAGSDNADVSCCAAMAPPNHEYDGPNA